MNEDNRAVYETRYDAAALRHPEQDRYDRSIAQVRRAYLERLLPDKIAADLGCGSGAYLFPATAVARLAIGVDFSETLLRAAAREASTSLISNVKLVLGDIRALPLRSDLVDVAYSFATLYHVRGSERAIREAARITRPGGHVLLELGNRYSLNTLVVPGVLTGARSHHISVAAMRRSVALAGLDIIEHRRFQLLPMYGGPRLLRPLVTSKWRWLMAREFRGRLLDERISSLPLLRAFAFRHFLLCRRS